MHVSSGCWEDDASGTGRTGHACRGAAANAPSVNTAATTTAVNSSVYDLETGICRAGANYIAKAAGLRGRGGSGVVKERTRPLKNGRRDHVHVCQHHGDVTVGVELERGV